MWKEDDTGQWEVVLSEELDDEEDVAAGQGDRAKHPVMEADQAGRQGASLQEENGGVSMDRETGGEDEDRRRREQRHDHHHYQHHHHHESNVAALDTVESEVEEEIDSLLREFEGIQAAVGEGKDARELAQQLQGMRDKVLRLEEVIEEATLMEQTPSRGQETIRRRQSISSITESIDRLQGMISRTQTPRESLDYAPSLVAIEDDHDGENEIQETREEDEEKEGGGEGEVDGEEEVWAVAQNLEGRGDVQAEEQSLSIAAVASSIVAQIVDASLESFAEAAAVVPRAHNEGCEELQEQADGSGEETSHQIKKEEKEEKEEEVEEEEEEDEEEERPKLALLNVSDDAQGEKRDETAHSQHSNGHTDADNGAHPESHGDLDEGALGHVIGGCQVEGGLDHVVWSGDVSLEDDATAVAVDMRGHTEESEGVENKEEEKEKEDVDEDEDEDADVLAWVKDVKEEDEDDILTGSTRYISREFGVDEGAYGGQREARDEPSPLPSDEPHRGDPFGDARTPSSPKGKRPASANTLGSRGVGRRGGGRAFGRPRSAHPLQRPNSEVKHLKEVRGEGGEKEEEEEEEEEEEDVEEVGYEEASQSPNRMRPPSRAGGRREGGGGQRPPSRRGGTPEGLDSRPPSRRGGTPEGLDSRPPSRRGGTPGGLNSRPPSRTQSNASRQSSGGQSFGGQSLGGGSGSGRPLSRGSITSSINGVGWLAFGTGGAHGGVSRLGGSSEGGGSRPESGRGGGGGWPALGGYPFGGGDEDEGVWEKVREGAGKDALELVMECWNERDVHRVQYSTGKARLDN